MATSPQLKMNTVSNTVKNHKSRYCRIHLDYFQQNLPEHTPPDSRMESGGLFFVYSDTLFMRLTMLQVSFRLSGYLFQDCGILEFLIFRKEDYLGDNLCCLGIVIHKG